MLLAHGLLQLLRRWQVGCAHSQGCSPSRQSVLSLYLLLLALDAQNIQASRGPRLPEVLDGGQQYLLQPQAVSLAPLPTCPTVACAAAPTPRGGGGDGSGVSGLLVSREPRSGDGGSGGSSGGGGSGGGGASRLALPVEAARGWASPIFGFRGDRRRPPRFAGRLARDSET
jgi:hypothetical protein